MLVLLYTMAFVAGPALFLVLAQFDGRLWPLALISSVLAVLSLALRNEATVAAGTDPGPLFFSVFMIWIAWILVLVLVVRAARHSLPTRRARRIAQGLGAMGTTLPWFGFTTAQMLAE